MKTNIELAKEGIVKDSIIKNYIKYIKHLESRNYIRENITIYELLSTIVTTNNIKANNEGIVLDILCPSGTILSIPGIKSFPENYQIEKIPPFELRLTNLHGEEIYPGTRIKILKNKMLGKPEEICEVLYEDVSMTNFSESPNKFKSYTELFRFEDGIELKGEYHLKIYVIHPNIDISNTKFNLGTDLWHL